MTWPIYDHIVDIQLGHDQLRDHIVDIQLGHNQLRHHIVENMWPRHGNKLIKQSWYLPPLCCGEHHATLWFLYEDNLID